MILTQPRRGQAFGQSSRNQHLASLAIYNFHMITNALIRLHGGVG